MLSLLLLCLYTLRWDEIKLMEIMRALRRVAVLLLLLKDSRMEVYFCENVILDRVTLLGFQSGPLRVIFGWDCGVN